MSSSNPEPLAGDAPEPGAALPSSPRWLERQAAALAAAGFGVAWLLSNVPRFILDPTRIGWLYEGDWVIGQLGWSFFRSAPFEWFPVGSNPLYPYGVGSTVGFSDAIPILAVLLRPVASILPTDFQYIGPWLALCFALQGFAGAKLASIVSPSRVAQAVAGALFVTAPPLLHRVLGPHTSHASLCAHFLPLTFLWLALAPVQPGGARRRLGAALVAVALSAGVHPYFTAMGAALALALVGRLALERRLTGREAVAGAAAAPGAAAAGLAVFGFLDPRVKLVSFGFGGFSADLFTLLNPMGWSRLWPGLPVREGQYEGFAYLGAGGLLLAAAALVALARRPPRGVRAAARSSAPAAVAALLLAGFALSGTITASGREVLRVGLYDLVPALTSTFRASGRFVWPLHYLVLFGAVAALAAALRARPGVLALVLGAALVVQVADVRPPEPLEVGDGSWESPFSAQWQLARGSYRHLALLPPFLLVGGRVAAPEPEACGPLAWSLETLIPVADLAYRLGLTFDGGYLSRLDEARAGAGCASVRRAVAEGRIDADTVWVVHPTMLAQFRAAGATCGTLDGAPVCVAGSRDDAFAAALSAHPIP